MCVDCVLLCVLTVFRCARQGLGPDSVRLYPLLTPVIALSTDLSGDAHVYLLEDGLALWQAAVENAPQMHPDFMEVRWPGWIVWLLSGHCAELVRRRGMFNGWAERADCCSGCPNAPLLVITQLMDVARSLCWQD